MQKSVEQKAQWQEIWGRQNLLDRVIDIGRTIYNFFFRRILRRYIQTDSTMLELGCGRASLTLSLAPEIRKLVGVDISDVALAQATGNARHHDITNASFVLGDCTKLNLTEQFDFVWSQGLMEHFDDPIIVASEHFRALKPGGVALISVPYKYSYHTLWYKLTRLRALRRFWPWTDQQFLGHTELLAIGKAVTPYARVFLLQPVFPLGIIFLEMRKPQLTQSSDT